MTRSRTASNHLISTPGSDPNRITNYGLRPRMVSETRQASLPETLIPDVHGRVPAAAAPVPGRGVRSGPANVSIQNTTVNASAKRSNPPHRQAARSCTWYRGDGWTLEIISATCSLCCFAAIVAVLKVYDGQRSPSLPFGITLNAIISILSTTAKSSIIFGVTAAMGQAKWDRLGTEGRYHRLLDLEHIDQASRGPLGSFRMLFTRTGRSIASVGAIVTLLMLAMDPFVQQILLYRQEPSAVASESAWTEQVLAPTIFSNDSDTVYLGAINSALWNDDVSYERKAHCPTGNCTYPSYQSMGLCVTTREVPLEQLSFGGSACNILTRFYRKRGQVIFKNIAETLYFTWSWANTPSGTCSVSFGDNTTSLPIQIPHVDAPGGSETSQYSESWQFPLDFTGPMEFDMGAENDILGVRSPLLALGRISWSSPSLVNNESMNLRFDKAEQVVVAFCAGDYLTTVSQGVTSTYGADMSSPSGFSYHDRTTILGPNATCWTSGSEKTTFPGAEVKHANHGKFIARASPMSFCTNNWGWGADIVSRLTSNSWVGIRMTSGTMSWRLSGTSGKNNRDVLNQIQSRTLQDISRSITASLNALFRKQSSDFIIGSCIEYDTVVRVQWPWLTLPVAVEVLGFMFLLLIALRNSKSQVPWKGSILAALFHGLKPGADDTESLETITSMEQEATKTMVKLETTDGGRRFLGKRIDGLYNMIHGNKQRSDEYNDDNLTILRVCQGVTDTSICGNDVCGSWAMTALQ